jgi:hypothetical protein
VTAVTSVTDGDRKRERRKKEMDYPQKTADDLVIEAGATAGRYLGYAITEIDRKLGKGYAEKHPALVATFMQVAARDFETANSTWRTGELVEAIKEIAEAIAHYSLI